MPGWLVRNTFLRTATGLADQLPQLPFEGFFEACGDVRRDADVQVYAVVLVMALEDLGAFM